MKKIKYHLRFQVVPGDDVAADARILAAFCLKHGIEEVVLFFAGEEWNNGLLSVKEEDMWFDTVGKSREILESKGISVSLNPWMTVLHTDRGRSFPADRRFKPMVSPWGEKSRACASFADRNWQKYISNLYGRFARLGFRVMWVEDDFRYHNHAPLTWGGGFEKGMCERFSRRIGKKVTRQEILENILRPGRPHPWRTKWMGVWKEAQLEAARGIADAVKKNSPVRTKLGLMSSTPWMHSIEGRRWEELFDSLSIDGDVAHRPSFASYCDSLGKSKVYSAMSLAMQKNFRQLSYEVAPEVENFPFTAWSKSDVTTWADMSFALFFGSDALLLDLFPFTGNRADEEPGIGDMLDRSHEALSWIAGRFSKEHNLHGIGIPWKQNAAELVRTEKGEHLNELAVDTMPAWEFLLSYGIPACAGLQDVNFLSGNAAWIFDDGEIAEMLKGGLLLDGISARILCARGFGRQIGVEYKRTLAREESTYSMEVVTCGDSGARKGFSCSVNLMPEFNVFEPVGGAVTWSEIITPGRERVGAGITLSENSSGGRTVVFTSEILDGGRLAYQKPSMSFQRQAMVQNAIRYLYNDGIPVPLVTGGPYLLPMYFRKRGEGFLVVFNGSPDPAPVSVEIKDKRIPENTTLLRPLEKPVSMKLIQLKKRGGNTAHWKSKAIPYMSFMVVKL